MTSTPTSPVDNVVITTKGLQDRKKQLFDGRTVENKGKLILKEVNLEQKNKGGKQRNLNAYVRGRNK